jgi:hypothetical protein
MEEEVRITTHMGLHGLKASESISAPPLVRGEAHFFFWNVPAKDDVMKVVSNLLLHLINAAVAVAAVAVNDVAESVEEIVYGHSSDLPPDDDDVHQEEQEKNSEENDSDEGLSLIKVLVIVAAILILTTVTVCLLYKLNCSAAASRTTPSSAKSVEGSSSTGESDDDDDAASASSLEAQLPRHGEEEESAEIPFQEGGHHHVFSSKEGSLQRVGRLIRSLQMCHLELQEGTLSVKPSNDVENDPSGCSGTFSSQDNSSSVEIIFDDSSVGSSDVKTAAFKYPAPWGQQFSTIVEESQGPPATSGIISDEKDEQSNCSSKRSSSQANSSLVGIFDDNSSVGSSSVTKTTFKYPAQWERKISTVEERHHQDNMTELESEVAWTEFQESLHQDDGEERQGNTVSFFSRLHV